MRKPATSGKRIRVQIYGTYLRIKTPSKYIPNSINIQIPLIFNSKTDIVGLLFARLNVLRNRSEIISCGLCPK